MLQIKLYVEKSIFHKYAKWLAKYTYEKIKLRVFFHISYFFQKIYFYSTIEKINHKKSCEEQWNLFSESSVCIIFTHLKEIVIYIFS